MCLAECVVPTGLPPHPFSYPALKRWAKVLCPWGAMAAIANTFLAQICSPLWDCAPCFPTSAKIGVISEVPPGPIKSISPRTVRRLSQIFGVHQLGIHFLRAAPQIKCARGAMQLSPALQRWVRSGKRLESRRDDTSEITVSYVNRKPPFARPTVPSARRATSSIRARSRHRISLPWDCRALP